MEILVVVLLFGGIGIVAYGLISLIRGDKNV